MRCAKTFCALAIALAIGFAAQPASAQRRRWRAARFAGPRMAQRQNARAFGPGWQNRNQAARPGRPGGFHPPAHPAGQQGHPNNGPGNPNAAHPPNSFRPPTNPNGGGANGPGANGRQNPNVNPAWGQRLRNMSPQQQEHFMQNNERFRSLPPEQQQQIRQRLQKWNNLPPAERDRMQHSYENWQRMSPQQKQYVQQTLLPKWQQMSPDRKQVVTDRLHTLQGMTPEDRQKALNDPQFMRGLNPDEQSVLRGLDSVRNPSNP